ncbi:OB-fold domain-containing protein [Bosea sp. (in: a-proteobacteria)]|uniref:Zn-ribbon domain-containing OB-fold protein n=1 Tax=Bosea sp. (in: a-proteobacteria) TaxID=1871050 RepID=UPI002605CD89|nr:OB-fold domain-containing protein [Bosea sp. (in: a-proteobacteria)]MCO5089595.1 OB-fold domain-containing protein [Bosea sp. (in: a-proteobacteria)]
MSAYQKPLPVIDDHNRRYWAATREGRLELPRCDACGAFHTYFEPWCNACGHEGVHWEQLSGRGRIWANCRFHKVYFPGFETPYNVAMVELEEGPRLVTNIVGLEHGTLDEMPIGLAVEVVFDAVTPEVTLVKFKPAGKAAA